MTKSTKFIGDMLKDEQNTPDGIKAGGEKPMTYANTVYNDGMFWDVTDYTRQDAPNRTAIASVPSGGVIGQAAEFIPDAGTPANSGQAELPHYAALDREDLTAGFWIKPYSVTSGTIFHREGYFELRVDYGSLVLSIGDSWEIWANNVIVNNAIQYVAVTVKKLDANRSRVRIYINAKRVANVRLYGHNLPLNNTESSYIAFDGSGNFFHGVIDEALGYNVALDETQIQERFNSGSGTQNLPTGITQATDLVYRFSDSGVNTAAPLGTGHDLINTIFNPVGGLIDNNNIAINVTADEFPSDRVAVKEYKYQASHFFKEGVNTKVHAHIGIFPNSGSGQIVLKTAHSWLNNFSPLAGLEENKIIIDVNDTEGDPNKNTGILFPVHLLELAGEDKKISSIVFLSLWRDPFDIDDTFDGSLFIVYADPHDQHDTPGSSTEWIK